MTMDKWVSSFLIAIFVALFISYMVIPFIKGFIRNWKRQRAADRIIEEERQRIYEEAKTLEGRVERLEALKVINAQWMKSRETLLNHFSMYHDTDAAGRAWLLDQAARILLEDKYDEWLDRHSGWDQGKDPGVIGGDR